MITQFLTLELDATHLSSSLQHTIEAQLKQQGEPLRWAIAAVSAEGIQVEAVILQEQEIILSDASDMNSCP
jgi:hypothetical protein